MRSNWFLLTLALILILYDSRQAALEGEEQVSESDLSRELSALRNSSYSLETIIRDLNGSSVNSTSNQPVLNQVLAVKQYFMLSEKMRLNYRNTSLRFHNLSSISTGRWNVSLPTEPFIPAWPTFEAVNQTNSTAMRNESYSVAVDGAVADYFDFKLLANSSWRWEDSRLHLFLTNNETLLPEIHFIYGNLRLQTDKNQPSLSLNFVGFHFTQEGLAYFAASQGRLRSMIPGLLMTLPTEFHLNQTFAVLEDRRRKRIEDIERQLSSGNIVDTSNNDTSAENKGKPWSNCSFYGRLIVQTVPNHVETVQQIVDYEDEIAEPTGRPTVDAFNLHMQAEMVSINCNCSVYFETTGVQMTRYWLKLSRFLAFSTLLAFIEIILIIRQTRQYSSSNMAACYRLSFWTFGAQSVTDASFFALYFALGISVEGDGGLQISFFALAFVKMVSFALFQARLLISIWQVYRQRNPLPQGGSQRTEFLPIYLRIYSVLSLSYFLFTLLPYSHRYLAFLLINSYWLPQIWWNFHTGQRSPLDTVYVVGTSCTRLLSPFLYAYGCPANVIQLLEPSPRISLILIAWMTVLVAALLYQRYFGPHYLILQWLPFLRRYVIARYNYCRLLPSSVLAAGDASPINCAICLMFINPQSEPTDLMIPPCDHPFHRQCLERWMQRKMECPVCRLRLPE